MLLDEELLAAGAIGCGDSVLVPVLRLRVRGLGPWVSAEAELVGVVLRRGAAGAFLAPDAAPVDAASWSAWLEARPELLRDIRARLAAGTSTR